MYENKISSEWALKSYLGKYRESLEFYRFVAKGVIYPPGMDLRV